MNLSQLIRDLGDDADLILKSDKWLLDKQEQLACLLDQYTKEYKAIRAAKAVKSILQSQNLIAVQRQTLQGTSSADIEIAKLPQASERFAQLPENDIAHAIPTLVDDGYDIIQSYLLRK